MLIIDRYAYGNKLSKSNPFVKFTIVVMALAVTTMAKSSYINLAVFILMVFLTTVVAGVPIGQYLKIFSIPISFLVISTITILISISNEDIYVWGIRVFNSYMGITRESIGESILITTRVLGSISATFFLGLTTPLNNIIRVLKKLYIPNTIIELMVLIYRTIFIFLQEANEIYTGQEIRFGYSSFKNSLNSISLLIRSLFLRVLLKYRDMVVCLECKLYDGEFEIGD